MTIFLTHTPEMRRNYYGEKALAGLAALAPVRFHESATPLDAAALIAAAQGCEIIVSDRQTPGGAAIFAALPDLVAFLRCAVDIRNVAVPAASANGILVTRASAGFVPAVTELVLGFLVDLARGVKVMVTDPYAKATAAGLVQTDLPQLLAESDFVVCLAVATDETENLMNAAAFARMKPSAYFINVSRGNLVDETALEAALEEKRIAGAALDVGRAPDQMPTLRLARRADVIATPHIGGLTPEAIEHQALETVAQAAEILRGKVPKGAVNAEQATRLARLRR